MPAFLRRPGGPRRGVTLVEMLVVVALVVLMMTILVQIFGSATGAMSASRAVQEMDVSLRRVDVMLRQDLLGATARFTPPLNPSDNLGYFEYGENAFADFQGEDGDDYLAFTTRAPEGQVFTGRQWLYGTATDANGNTVVTVNQNVQPTTITSSVAEVIYFLRNGNLYRRTFLVAPDRAKSLVGTVILPPAYNVFPTTMFGPKINATWQGMNDISARPSGYSTTGLPIFTPTPNTLGDLTNRENRAFRPRFANDFNLDGYPDDGNGDDIPDYYPTLYYDGAGYSQTNPSTGATIGWAPNRHVHEGSPYTTARVEQGTSKSYDVYAFPFIYPGMYSVPDPATVGSNQGWLHYLYPATVNKVLVPNHSPLELGDQALPTANQTWWGFPTWRETMSGLRSGVSKGWTDPIYSVLTNGNMQPQGLNPFSPTTTTLTSTNFPPPVTIPGTSITPFGFDGAGSTLLANSLPAGAIWEDDLILTNVRSFDVKAYDAEAPLYGVDLGMNIGTGYYDLGYADYYSPNAYAAGLNATTYGNNGYLHQPNLKEPVGFGHQGRIPPISADFRPHPTLGFNIGDDSTGVIRLRRVFDTWSTDYSNAPASDIFLNGNPSSPGYLGPIYPSFPAPYPTALRGIQIQIRVNDPRGERVRVLTIRQDFTDKL